MKLFKRRENTAMSLEAFAPLLAVLSTLLASLLAIAGIRLQNEARRRQQLEEELSEKKREAYSSVNALLTKLFGFQKVLEKSRSTKQSEKQMDEMSKALMESRQKVWTFGSPKVISAYSALQQVSFRPQGNAIVVLTADLILAMREDMGLSNDGITALDILRIFLTDADKTYDEARAAAEEFKQKLRTRTNIPLPLSAEPDQPQR